MECCSCGSTNPEDASYCCRCGTSLEENKGEVSRRDFLKTAGLGVAGVGALALTGSASALSFKTDNQISFKDNLKIGSKGKVNLQGNNITNVKSLKIKDLKNTRNVTINGEEVVIGHRIITSTLPLSDIESSSKIQVREGDVYQQIEES